jgi:gluconolactonase
MNETIATALHQPDGLVALKDGGVALVEAEAGGGALIIIGAQGVRHEICRVEGHPIGLAIDGDGCFWVAGGPGNTVVRLSPDGQILRTIAGTKDQPFVLPKNLAFGPDGLLYMSDCGVRLSDLVDDADIRPDYYDAAYNGRIYQIDPQAGRVLRTLATGLLMANGVAFDAEGLLYYSETLTGTVYRQVIGGKPQTFAHVSRSQVTGGLKGPAGLAFNRSGMLYCAKYGEGDICLIDPTGKIVGHIPTNGRLPDDIAFTQDGKYALIAEHEHGALEKIPVPSPGGLPLHTPAL